MTENADSNKPLNPKLAKLADQVLRVLPTYSRDHDVARIVKELGFSGVKSDESEVKEVLWRMEEDLKAYREDGVRVGKAPNVKRVTVWRKK